jgi:hypothetical protein
MGHMKLNIHQAHKRLGHPCEDKIHRAAEVLGWELTRRDLGTCEACGIANAQQKNVPDLSIKPPGLQRGEGVFI